MTKYVPHTEPDFDTTADGLSVAFRDRGGQHHALVTAQFNPLTGGNEIVVGGVTDPAPSLSADGIIKTSGQNKFRNAGANEFRAQGGIVAAYYYGEWRQRGLSYNQHPWAWLNGFQDRLPIPSICLPTSPEWTFGTSVGSLGWTSLGGTFSAGADNLRLTASGADPVFYSPNNLGLIGGENLTLEVQLKKIAGAVWEGKCYFTTTTDGAWNAAKSVSLSEPTWDGSVKTLSVSMAANAYWTGGTIKQLRLDFGNDVTSVYELYSVKLIQSGRSITESKKTYGMPSDKQWAVDWEIKTAYDHGIDVFVHNFYWNSVSGLPGNSNHQKYNLDLHAASTKRPMQFAIQWSNHEDTSPFSNLSALNAMLDEWYSYFVNSKYWVIDGKPVLYIFSTDRLRTAMSTLFAVSTQESGKTFVQYVNNYLAAKSSSVCPDGVFFVGQGLLDHPYWWGSSLNAKAWIEYSEFSAGTRYNQLKTYIDQDTTYNYETGIAGGSASAVYPASLNSYEQLREVHRKSQDWSLNAGSGIPYFGAAMAGWDKRPWQDYKAESFSSSWNCIASPADFAEHLVDVRDAVLNAKSSGKYHGIPVVNIFAWNEYGEGGFICPTRRYGYGMAEAVLEVFGRSEA